MATRQTVATYTFFDAEGNESRDPFAEAIGVRTTYKGDYAEWGTKEFRFADAPEEIRTLAMQHGFKQKLGDSKSQADEENSILDCYETVSENLIAGVWAKRRQGGSKETNVTMLMEAVFAALAEKGVEVTDEKREATIKAIKEDEDLRDSLKKDALVKKHYEEMKAKRAAERAKAAAKSAKESKGESALDGLFG